MRILPGKDEWGPALVLSAVCSVATAGALYVWAERRTVVSFLPELLLGVMALIVIYAVFIGTLRVTSWMRRKWQLRKAPPPPPPPKLASQDSVLLLCSIRQLLSEAVTAGLNVMSLEFFRTEDGDRRNEKHALLTDLVTNYIYEPCHKAAQDMDITVQILRRSPHNTTSEQLSAAIDGVGNALMAFARLRQCMRWLSLAYKGEQPPPMSQGFAKRERLYETNRQLSDALLQLRGRPDLDQLVGWGNELVGYRVDPPGEEPAAPQASLGVRARTVSAQALPSPE